MIKEKNTFKLQASIDKSLLLKAKSKIEMRLNREVSRTELLTMVFEGFVND